MPAIWTWNDHQIPLFVSSDGEGFFVTQAFPIAAPLSLQRVVVRASLSGRRFITVFGNPVPAVGGAIRLQVSVQDDSGTRQYYGASRGVEVSHVMHFNDPGGSSWQDIHWSVQPYDVDLTIRRAAPAPPANAMLLTVYLNYSPDPFQPGAQYAYPTAWAGDLDILWLTSEPGPTTPP